MFCPQCQAEYREGFTVCADCEVPLVTQPPAPANPPNTDEPMAFAQDDPEDPFCKLWEGGDARICADLCGVLDEAGIPHRVLRQEAHIFRISPNSQIKLGVPFSLYEKAEQAIAEAFGGEVEAQRLLRPSQENRPALDALMPQSVKAKQREYETRSPLAARFSALEEDITDNQQIVAAGLPQEPGMQYNDQLTHEVWRGSAAELVEFLQSCLKENKIACLPAAEAAEIRLLVGEYDEARAKEIVREVLEGTPPTS